MKPALIRGIWQRSKNRRTPAVKSDALSSPRRPGFRAPQIGGSPDAAKYPIGDGGAEIYAAVPPAIFWRASQRASRAALSIRRLSTDGMESPRISPRLRISDSGIGVVAIPIAAVPPSG